MTLFAACLFALAAFASAGTIVFTWLRYGSQVWTLHAQLRACPGDTVVHWKREERLTLPLLPDFTTARAARRVLRSASMRIAGTQYPGSPAAALAA